MIEKAPRIELNTEIKNIIYKTISSSSITLYSSSIKKIENEYYYWDKVKHLKDDKIHIFKTNITPNQLLWFITKTRRDFLSKTGYLFGDLLEDQVYSIEYQYNVNEYLQRKLHYLDFNFGAGLQKEQLLSELEKQQYLNNALMEEAVFSSMIEGATTTRVKAKEMLRKNKKPKTHSEQMILNNYNTIQYISKHKEDNITINKLYELHRLVTENTLDEDSVGVFRNSNDVNVVNELTGEVVHTPPDFNKLEGLMNSFVSFFNNNPKEDFIHPIVKASILHFLIGYIHPFVDGNGRTARAIFYWYLLKNGYWLTEYLSISRVIMKTKTQYEKAYLYTEIDDMDATYFIHYQVKVLIRAFEDLKEYVAKKKKEETKLLKFLRLGDINERQAEILYKIEKKPNTFFTVKEIENSYGVTNQTARTDLEELVFKGFLKKIAINKKSYNYWKGDNFESIL
ncbi:Fic family protein [Tenacibaculum larymnensis]|uniref:Fic family protein n=1 Tax=Tenacibaculum larymnensis TaxID=2878201 RepID=A0A9X4EP63_9FLAO|nr:Fic family protein [Tenacibaculum larymnensis]MDE1205605.1 Fic family protein [Tenacibaculum larymnensis]